MKTLIFHWNVNVDIWKSVNFSSRSGVYIVMRIVSFRISFRGSLTGAQGEVLGGSLGALAGEGTLPPKRISRALSTTSLRDACMYTRACF